LAVSQLLPAIANNAMAEIVKYVFIMSDTRAVIRQTPLYRQDPGLPVPANKAALKVKPGLNNTLFLENQSDICVRF
jgi:hypothetical protein